MPFPGRFAAIFPLIDPEFVEFLEKPRTRNGLGTALKDDSGSLGSTLGRILLLNGFQGLCELTHLPGRQDSGLLDQIAVMTGLVLAYVLIQNGFEGILPIGFFWRGHES